MKLIAIFLLSFVILPPLHARDLAQPLRETQRVIAAADAALDDRESMLEAGDYVTLTADAQSDVDLSVVPMDSADQEEVAEPPPQPLVKGTEYDIEIGMTREQVLALWGEPQGQAMSGRREFLHYRRGREVTLEDGLVVRVEGASVTGTRTRESVDFDMDFTFDDEQFLRMVAFVESWNEVMEGPVGIAINIFSLLCILLLFVSFWKIYVKAGEHGWAWLIPIYNLIVLLRIADKPLWWILLLLIPFVNFVVGILVFISFAQRFGKSALFGIGLIFLPYIFYPILAFGSAEFIGGEE